MHTVSTPPRRGIIALDIDGTIAVPAQAAEQAVLDFLQGLAHEGWQLIFLTGRTFAWGYQAVQALQCPYLLSVQNGALTLEMPARDIRLKKYLDSSIFPLMEDICADEPSDFAVFTGFENRDRCYYRPQYFSKELLRYLEQRMAALNETWQPLHSYDSLDCAAFPSLKCFGQEASARRLADKIEKQLGLHAPLIRDPYHPHYYIVQATQRGVTKGAVLRELFLKTDDPPLIIAAGDDYNDMSLFEVADIKIAMEQAPDCLRTQADIIAPSAESLGILSGLSQALAQAQRRRA